MKRWVVLALAVLAVPMPNPLQSAAGASRGIPREAVFSLSPAEVLLPPVEAAISRLSAESASASCWAQRLLPQRRGCAAR